MENSHTLSGLSAKRAEISGYLKELEERAQQMRIQLLHLDSAIKLFAPDFDPNTIRPIRRRKPIVGQFKRGEFSRLCLSELRKAKGALLQTNDLVARILAAKGLPTDDSLLRASLRTRVLAHLRIIERRGVVKREGAARHAVWALMGA